MKKIFQLLMIIGLGLILDSCYNNKFPIVDPNAPPSETVISFATDIQPIFDANCIACHSGNLNPDLRSGNSYSALMALPVGSIVAGDADGSELMEMLNHDPGSDNPMPPGSPLPLVKRTLFANWINQGALNN